MELCRSRKGYTMDQTTPIIYNVQTPEYGKIIIVTSNGYVYEADLATFKKVFCFPKNFAEWAQVSIDSDGLALIWKTRFEIHVDQVLALATSHKILSQENSAQA